jgi:hypothetical protein
MLAFVSHSAALARFAVPETCQLGREVTMEAVRLHNNYLKLRCSTGAP